MDIWIPKMQTPEQCFRETADGDHLDSQVFLFLNVRPLSLVAQTVKNPPAMQERQVLSVGQEEPLEEGMTTYSSTLGWRIPKTEEPGGLQSMGLQRVRHN